MTPARTLVRAVALLAVAAGLAVPLPSAAQLQLGSDAVARDFFPPRLVFQHAEAIALQESQRAAIEAEGAEAAREFARLRFDLNDALRRMIGLANQHPVDENQILDQLDAVLELERGIKTLQLRMLVRVKNTLTPEQQEQLRELRRRSRMPERPR